MEARCENGFEPRGGRMRERLSPGWALVWIVGLLLVAILVIVLVSVGTGSGSGGS